MGAFQIKADDAVADRASAAVEQYRVNHQLANRGDALAQLVPLLERAAAAGGADAEAENHLAQVRSLAAAIEVEAQALATRVATAKATERAAVQADLDNAEQVAQAAKEQSDRFRADLDAKQAELDAARGELVEREAEAEQLRAQLNAVLGLKQEAERAR